MGKGHPLAPARITAVAPLGVSCELLFELVTILLCAKRRPQLDALAVGAAEAVGCR
jgi:hypothetical protein